MIRQSYIFGAVCIAAMALSSCKEDSNSPGVEYMPDMYRSPALEAYIDYGDNNRMDWTQNQKDGDSTYMGPILSQKPVPGTIPYSSPEMAVYMLPYPLNNTMEDYERAATEIHSPMTATRENVMRGQAIYTKMCTHCHGEAGHGDGAISRNGFIQGIPDYSGKLKDLPEGKIFHTITYGKGLMGQHASQLTQYERWQVTQWVKLLQKGITEPTFDAKGMLVIETTAPAATDSTSKS
jgi:mono/diheme cytochrome c family protein